MLLEEIKKDFMTAYKAKETTVAETLKMVKSAIQYKEVELKAKQAELTDDDIVSILKAEVKKRKESIEQWAVAKRDDMVKKEQQEIEIIQKYLPPQMSFEQIQNEVQNVMKNLGEASADFGQVMKASMKSLKGKAEGSDIKKAIDSLMKK